MGGIQGRGEEAGPARWAVVNGKRVRLRPGDTVDLLRRRQGESGSDLALRLGAGGKAEPLKGSDEVEAGDRIVTVPPIVKGAGAARQAVPAPATPGPATSGSAATLPALPARVVQELELLRRALGGGCRVEAGPLREDGRTWSGVLVHNVRLNERKFGTTHSKLLLLLPEGYPGRPPLGCYLHYRHPARDHHFTLRSHYGAPSLEERGWYWYCVGLGGGFDAAAHARLWRPGARPEDGHNLTTLVAAALLAINGEQ